MPTLQNEQECTYRGFDFVVGFNGDRWVFAVDDLQAIGVAETKAAAIQMAKVAIDDEAFDLGEDDL
jgi:hypothetical protein